MAVQYIGAMLLLLAVSVLSLESTVPAELTIAELELQSLRLKRELLQQKLTLLEESRSTLGPSPDLPREGL